MDEYEDIILLPMFRFPEHWQIQEWLNGTDYHKEFDLVLAEVPRLDRNGKPGNTSVTTPGLAPKTRKAAFYWKLKGEEGAKELEQKVLDFKLDKAL